MDRFPGLGDGVSSQDHEPVALQSGGSAPRGCISGEGVHALDSADQDQVSFLESCVPTLRPLTLPSDVYV